ncbi:hypothetical protein RHGRI_025766 [Rhododendron griersonianum]|uniref:PB1 domain-containing protein n=1 Tax=Rhododendron griersonianum TaxID=479676 RepID=A0AAV6IVH6_9ERIC|nr:hypothetical protein RHGRI_025766 [Rhododendron griersonianum]
MGGYASENVKRIAGSFGPGVNKIRGLTKYRLLSQQLKLGVSGGNEDVLGLPGRVFRGRLPESSLSIHHYSSNEWPRQDEAVECGVQSCLGLPLFDKGGICVGVMEMTKTRTRVCFKKTKAPSVVLTLDDIEQCKGMRQVDAMKFLNVSKSTFQTNLKNLKYSQNGRFARDDLSLIIGSTAQPSKGKNPAMKSSHGKKSAESVKHQKKILIKAKVGPDDAIKFHMSYPVKFDALELTISKRMEINVGAFLMKYEDEDPEKIRITNDEDVQLWIETCNVLGKREPVHLFISTTTVTLPASLAFLVSNFHSLVNIILDGPNYLLWRVQVEYVMIGNGYYEYFTTRIIDKEHTQKVKRITI